MNSRSRRVESRLGNAPRNSQLAPYSICLLTISRLVDSRRLPAGALITSDGIRYSNIEPDQETSAAAPSIGRRLAAKFEPMFRWCVCLCDSEKTRQPGFGGKEIVAVGVSAIFFGDEPDRHQLTRRIHEKAKVHVMCDLAGRLGQFQQGDLAGSKARRPRHDNGFQLFLRNGRGPNRDGILVAFGARFVACGLRKRLR